MEINEKINLLQEEVVTRYNEASSSIRKNDCAVVSETREKGMQAFKKVGFPKNALEAWKNTDIYPFLDYSYKFLIEESHSAEGVDQSFECQIPQWDTYYNINLNGWSVSDDQKLQRLDNGVLLGSIAAAMKEVPELVEAYYGKLAKVETNGLIAMNSAMAQDGFFVYVPDNVEVDKTIQVVNLINHPSNIFIQLRNLILLGKNSKMQLLQCDDSLNHNTCFTNSVTEVFLADGANLDHYKLQNINDTSALVNTAFFSLESNSTLSTNAIVLNGGLIRNESYADLNGRGAHADLYGVYLMDKEQHVDNHVRVSHKYPDCTSNQLFKGIVDDNASAVFNGYVHVFQDAQRTRAFQNNKNIALTDKAIINTKPFLEIYADDVKCSHGATVGQLDKEALFYIKSRGISEYNAQLLLMYAFAAEVINTIKIEPLLVRVDDLVKKRLRGEISVCDQCVLNCSSKENANSLEIDMSKI